MTLDELSTAWNDLRNSALGRGVAPNVPPKLAEEVERRWGMWRNALQGLPPAAQDWSQGYTWKWVKAYRRLLAKVQKAGAGPKNVLPETTFEQTADALTIFSTNVAIGLGVAGAATVLYFVATRRGNGA